MSDNALLSSPNELTGTGLKRRRKIWSCQECRRRKLQCDRTLPACSRCVRTGKPEHCIYIDDVDMAAVARVVPTDLQHGTLHGRFNHGGPMVVPTEDVVASYTLENLVQRVKQLEAAQPHEPVVAEQSSNSSILAPTPGSAITGTGTGRNGRETTLFLGRAFRTKFSGSTHSGLLISRIPGFPEFMTESFERFPAMNLARKQVHKLENLTNLAEENPQGIRERQLRALLPPKQKSDQLVQVFIDSFDCVYHVLHLPNFRTEYNRLWIDTADGNQQFVVVVVLIISVSLCLVSDPVPYSACQRAATMIRSCEQWLKTNFLKYSRMQDFQISFLLLLARQLNARRYKQTWANSGEVLRNFMCAGLHRDPNNLEVEVSELDKEMRRRIWAAASEFELQASFEQGMPAMPWPEQSDILAPRNIPDDGLDHIADPRPVQEFTSSSYLAVSGSSILLRHMLNAHLNNLRSEISFDETKAFTERIETSLEELPSWTDPRSETCRALLSINLRQYLLSLHERQIRRAASPAERRFSKIILLDTAVKMVNSHKALLDSGHNALKLFCGDHIRAALSICYTYVTLDPQSDFIITRAAEKYGAQAIEAATAMLKQKAIHLGGDQRHLWPAIAANIFMKLKSNPDKRNDLMREAADEYLSILRQIKCGLQELLKTSAETRSKVNDNTLQERGFSVIGVDEQMLMVPPSLEAWSFEDWNFDDYNMHFTDSLEF
jgi:hypothetical protein